MGSHKVYSATWQTYGCLPNEGCGALFDSWDDAIAYLSDQADMFADQDADRCDYADAEELSGWDSVIAELGAIRTDEGRAMPDIIVRNDGEMMSMTVNALYLTDDEYTEWQEDAY